MNIVNIATRGRKECATRIARDASRHVMRVNAFTQKAFERNPWRSTRCAQPAEGLSMSSRNDEVLALYAARAHERALNASRVT